MPQRATDERSRWPESVFTFPESVFNLPGMRVHLRPESVFKIVRNTQVRRGSFEAPLPPCDAVATSLALHHVPTMARKRRLYARIYRALRPGGVFVNADVAISAHPVACEETYRRWVTHLGSCGIDEQRAYAHFDAWATEDTYFPVDDELAAMRDATFQAECLWQDPPHTLLVGRKT